MEDGEVTLIRGAMPREDGLRGRRQGARVNASDGHGMWVPWESQDSGRTLHASGDPRQTMWKGSIVAVTLWQTRSCLVAVWPDSNQSYFNVNEVPKQVNTDRIRLSLTRLRHAVQ